MRSDAVPFTPEERNKWNLTTDVLDKILEWKHKSFLVYLLVQYVIGWKQLDSKICLTIMTLIF